MWCCLRASWCSTLRRSGTCSTCASLWTQTLMLGCLEEVRASRSLAGAGVSRAPREGLRVASCSCYCSSAGRAARKRRGADPDPVHHLREASLRGVLPAGIIAFIHSKMEWVPALPTSPQLHCVPLPQLKTPMPLHWPFLPKPGLCVLLSPWSLSVRAFDCSPGPILWAALDQVLRSLLIHIKSFLFFFFSILCSKS